MTMLGFGYLCWVTQWKGIVSKMSSLLREIIATKSFILALVGYKFVNNSVKCTVEKRSKESLGYRIRKV